MNKIVLKDLSELAVDNVSERLVIRGEGESDYGKQLNIQIDNPTLTNNEILSQLSADNMSSIKVLKDDVEVYTSTDFASVQNIDLDIIKNVVKIELSD